MNFYANNNTWIYSRWVLLTTYLSTEAISSLSFCSVLGGAYILLMAILALSAALLLNTSPTDFPGNKRDRMEMTSSFWGSSSSPMSKSPLAPVMFCNVEQSLSMLMWTRLRLYTYMQLMIHFLQIDRIHGNIILYYLWWVWQTNFVII